MNPDNNPNTLYSEDQRFNSIFFRIIVAFSAIITFYMLFTKLILVNPPQDRDYGVLVPVIIAGVVFPLLFFLTKLKIRIESSGIFFRFTPFHLKWYHISVSEIQEASSITYRPIRDYGGWGIRYGWKGRAYNVSGNKGLQIKTIKGENILFGTQKPDEFLKVLESIRKP